MMIKKIIVAGGAGFLGSHLCDYLVEKGNEVHCIDNLYTGKLKNLSHYEIVEKRMESIKALDTKEDTKEHTKENTNFLKMDKKKKQIYYYRMDIGSNNFVTDFMKTSELDNVHQIYNLACPASPVHYQRDPVFTWKTSVFGTYNLLELCAKLGARFLLASTSEVYGEPLEHPQSESLWAHLNTLGPRSCYDLGKAAAETITADFAHKYKLHGSIARIFNVYGPRMCPMDGRIISNFMTQALSGQPLTVYGDGSQTRSFCYVDDMIEALYRLMEYPTALKPCNLGNPSETTVLEIAKKISLLLENKKNGTNKNNKTDEIYERNKEREIATEGLEGIEGITGTEEIEGKDGVEEIEKKKEIGVKNTKIINKRANENILYLESRVDDPSRRKPDITLAKDLLNWSPQTHLDKGLQITFSYFKNIE